MFTIYHNTRCSKSREALKLLQDSNQNFKIVEYLKEPLTSKELKEIINQLQIKPIDLVRVKEKIWKEEYAHQKLTNNQIIEILTKEPKLIERPIITNGKKAVIGRPIENLDELISETKKS